MNKEIIILVVTVAILGVFRSIFNPKKNDKVDK
ncbi:hypothetical protein SAMN05421842_10980 [Clostridium uliginosum]|uniref:Uncharacterized protein n=1 Tax=Clostridium uliginosum TaxID=119641 RepID=A0A1I1LY29_9CLOT|nr:hypothetical protein SAMN05421842_10980 [Clostridium uliginosum]